MKKTNPNRNKSLINICGESGIRCVSRCSLLFLMFSLISCTYNPSKTYTEPTKTSSIPTASPTPSSTPEPTAAAPARLLFFVESQSDFVKQINLYEIETQRLISETIDLTQFNWSVTTGYSRFSSMNGGELFQYNPNTGEIFFSLYAKDNFGMGFESPDVTPIPMPPFSCAIYKTSFENPDQLIQLYTESDMESCFGTSILDPLNDSLYFEKHSGSGISPFEMIELNTPLEIMEFNTTSQTMESILTINDDFKGGKLKEHSILRFSPDYQELFQLLIYGNAQTTIDQSLVLMTLDLQNGSAKYQEVISGDMIEYDVFGISGDGDRIVYVLNNPQYNVNTIYVRDFVKNQVNEISLPVELGNYNLLISSNAERMLIGLVDRTNNSPFYYWDLYDFTSQTFRSTPLYVPMAWDVSGQYLFGTTKENEYILFDLKAMSEKIIRQGAPDSCNVETAQFH